MLAAVISTGTVALVALAGLFALLVRSRILPGPTLIGRTLVVHTRRPDDQTIRGILHGAHADRWTLRDAVIVTPAGEQAAGGLQHIPVKNIAFAQEIEP
jgi:hypothetical protein